MPSVSIVIPCYNHGRYLGEAIECCLAQTHNDVEIIVVNDGSTDNTADVLEQFQNRIIAVSQPNSGLPGARNTGILHSSGEYIQFLDADDRIEPTKLAEQVKTLNENPDAGVCWCDGWLIDPAGNRIGPANINHPSGDVLHSLLTMWGTQVAAVLVRRSALMAVGLHEQLNTWFNASPTIRGCEDLDLWLRLAARFPFVAIPEKLFEYRVGNYSMSSNVVMMLKSGLEVLRLNSTHHGSCIQCRRAVNAGRRRWKTVATFGLMQQARELIKERRWFEASARVASVARYHPLHLLHVIAPKYWHSKLTTLTGIRNG